MGSVNIMSWTEALTGRNIDMMAGSFIAFKTQTVRKKYKKEEYKFCTLYLFIVKSRI